MDRQCLLTFQPLRQHIGKLPAKRRGHGVGHSNGTVFCLSAGYRPTFFSADLRDAVFGLLEFGIVDHVGRVASCWWDTHRCGDLSATLNRTLPHSRYDSCTVLSFTPLLTLSMAFTSYTGTVSLAVSGLRIQAHS